MDVVPIYTRKIRLRTMEPGIFVDKIDAYTEKELSIERTSLFLLLAALLIAFSNSINSYS